jgi:hypothetical protein
MSSFVNCNTRFGNIILPPAILFSIAIPETANYTVIFSLIGIGTVSGYGTWKANWQLIDDGNGRFLNSVIPLNGDSFIYPRNGNPSVEKCLGNLQINIVYPSNAPFNTRPDTTISWEGLITLSGGSVLGVLNKVDNNNNSEPLIYNVTGIYNIKCENCQNNIYIRNLKICN